MSETEVRKQKAELLLDLDDQKALVARLQEKKSRQKDAFEAFSRALGFPVLKLECKKQT